MDKSKTVEEQQLLDRPTPDEQVIEARTSFWNNFFDKFQSVDEDESDTVALKDIVSQYGHSSNKTKSRQKRSASMIDYDSCTQKVAKPAKRSKKSKSVCLTRDLYPVVDEDGNDSKASKDINMKVDKQKPSTSKVVHDSTSVADEDQKKSMSSKRFYGRSSNTKAVGQKTSDSMIEHDSVVEKVAKPATRLQRKMSVSLTEDVHPVKDKKAIKKSYNSDKKNNSIAGKKSTALEIAADWSDDSRELNENDLNVLNKSNNSMDAKDDCLNNGKQKHEYSTRSRSPVKRAVKPNNNLEASLVSLQQLQKLHPKLYQSKLKKKGRSKPRKSPKATEKVQKPSESLKEAAQLSSDLLFTKMLIENELKSNLAEKLLKRMESRNNSEEFQKWNAQLKDEIKLLQEKISFEHLNDYMRHILESCASKC